MILEVAILNVILGQEDQFQADFQRAQNVIVAMLSYPGHNL